MPKSKSVNLTKIFASVTKELAANRHELNQADDYNHDHGDNMVEIFDTITRATKEKKTAEPSDQLAYAADLLGQRSSSGSARIYQEGLVNASQEFKGQKIDANNLMGLVSTLMGAEQTAKPKPQSGSDDILGSLLGGLMGGEQTAKPKPQSGSQDILESLLGGMLGGEQTPKPKPQSGSQDMLGSLLGGLMGGGSQTPDSGLDGADLLTAAMAYMKAKQKGQSNVEALLNAFVGASRMDGSSHREQSSKIVLNTLLKALSGAK